MAKPTINTDSEVQVLEAVGGNASSFRQNWKGNVKYALVGMAFGVVFVLSVWAIKKFNIKTLQGEEIPFHPKPFHKGQLFGGLLFGLGWAMTGACPGPLYAQVGSGFSVVIVTLFFALLGTWVYGKFQHKLPH